MLEARRHEISRLEAFSDAAFAFALTLLVVSLDVPKSYNDLMRLIRGIPSFACCFALLVWIWHEHNLFFRRYGLQDSMTVFLNSVLMFVALFYVYPLKFMFDSMFARFVRDPTIVPMSLSQLATASTIYGSGFFVLLSMFALLYMHAYRKRTELRLTPLEVFDVKAFAGHHMVSASVGVLAVLVAVAAPLQFAPLSPTCFALMGPAHWWFGTLMGRRRRVLERRLTAPVGA
jgi:uncharacterized membrane protein